MGMVKGVNLVVRFVLELCVLGALGVWGFQAHPNLLVRILLGLGAPLVAAVVWGLFVSPKATIPLTLPLWILVQVGVFGAAMLALVAMDRSALAVGLGLAAVVNVILIQLLKSF